MKKHLVFVLVMSMICVSQPVRGGGIVPLVVSAIGNAASLSFIAPALNQKNGLVGEQKMIRLIGGGLGIMAMPTITAALTPAGAKKASVATDVVIGALLAYVWNFAFPGTFESPIRVAGLTLVAKLVGVLATVPQGAMN